MNQSQWRELCDQVTTSMKIHTRPFVTPLVQDVFGKKPRVGTGTYVADDGIKVLTCEHVARHGPFLHQFYDRDDWLHLPDDWRSDRPPIDAALGRISEMHWNSREHASAGLSFDRFDEKHQAVEHELLFFRGVSGENVAIGSEHSRVITTGYCSQEAQTSDECDVFEILWNPLEATVTQDIEDEIQSKFRFDDPAGFSGSLVWNTRFVESGCDITKWSPGDAKVTGLLRRWDTTSKTLIAWRVENLISWLQNRKS